MQAHQLKTPVPAAAMTSAISSETMAEVRQQHQGKVKWSVFARPAPEGEQLLKPVEVPKQRAEKVPLTQQEGEDMMVAFCQDMATSSSSRKVKRKRGKPVGGWPKKKKRSKEKENAKKKEQRKKWTVDRKKKHVEDRKHLRRRRAEQEKARKRIAKEAAKTSKKYKAKQNKLKRKEAKRKEEFAEYRRLSKPVESTMQILRWPH